MPPKAPKATGQSGSSPRRSSAVAVPKAKSHSTSGRRKSEGDAKTVPKISPIDAELQRLLRTPSPEVPAASLAGSRRQSFVEELQGGDISAAQRRVLFAEARKGYHALEEKDPGTQLLQELENEESKSTLRLQLVHACNAVREAVHRLTMESKVVNLIQDLVDCPDRSTRRSRASSMFTDFGKLPSLAVTDIDDRGDLTTDFETMLDEAEYIVETMDKLLRRDTSDACLSGIQAETLRIVSLVNGLRDVCSDRAEYLQTLQEDQLEIGAEIQRVLTQFGTILEDFPTVVSADGDGPEEDFEHLSLDCMLDSSEAEIRASERLEIGAKMLTGMKSISARLLRVNENLAGIPARLSPVPDDERRCVVRAVIRHAVSVVAERSAPSTELVNSSIEDQGEALPCLSSGADREEFSSSADRPADSEHLSSEQAAVTAIDDDSPADSPSLENLSFLPHHVQKKLATPTLENLPEDVVSDPGNLQAELAPTDSFAVDVASDVSGPLRLSSNTSMPVSPSEVNADADPLPASAAELPHSSSAAAEYEEEASGLGPFTPDDAAEQDDHMAALSPMHGVRSPCSLLGSPACYASSDAEAESASPSSLARLNAKPEPPRPPRLNLVPSAPQPAAPCGPRSPRRHPRPPDTAGYPRPPPLSPNSRLRPVERCGPRPPEIEGTCEIPEPRRRRRKSIPSPSRSPQCKTQRRALPVEKHEESFLMISSPRTAMKPWASPKLSRQLSNPEANESADLPQERLSNLERGACDFVEGSTISMYTPRKLSEAMIDLDNMNACISIDKIEAAAVSPTAAKRSRCLLPPISARNARSQ